MLDALDIRRRRSLADWFFRDRQTGRIVIGQAPNMPILVYAVARVAARTAPPAWRSPALRTSQAALAVWAVDEALRGVNPWRRCLGVAGLFWLASDIRADADGA